jgi:cephalosporin-C deacetylase-like acetyl esterase
MQRRNFLEGLTSGGLLLASRAVLGSETASKGEHDMEKEDSGKRRQRLYKLLGDLPPQNRKSSVETLSTTEKEGFVLEKLVLDLNGLEPVPAYFIRPQSSSGRVPAILYNHWHGGMYQLGKDQLLWENPESGLPSYAQVFAKQGYCALCIDHWAFGERSTRTEMDLFKEMLWRGQVLWGMMVYDSLRALDYLESRPEADPKRIATLGMSMGSTMAWWLAALDNRIKVCVDICCLTDFQALLDTGGLKGHGIYYFVPSLLKYFTTSQINALIAPRAHLGLAGNKDPLTPPSGLDRIDLELKSVYQKLGNPNHWKLLRYDVGHEETPEMRKEIVAFLEEFL